LAVALSYLPATRPGPKAASRRAFRHCAKLPPQPLGVEALAAIARARADEDRVFTWDARLEASLLATLAYLWRRGRGEKWAGYGGSALYACSIAQLVFGLAPIMGWRDVPDRRDVAGRRRFVKRHRKSVQRWLAWLARAGLVSHVPQQDEEGFWWRTIIELHAAPPLIDELLRAAGRRRRAWLASERRRQARGRARDLTAILRRSRLTKAQRRSRGLLRRQELRQHATQARVRQNVARSLADAAKTHLTHPFGVSTTSRSSLQAISDDKPLRRRLTHELTPDFLAGVASQANNSSTERATSETGENFRWAIYRQVMGLRFSRPAEDWTSVAKSTGRRVRALEDWPAGRPCPRSRLIEAWALAAYGPVMAAVGARRLALWREPSDHHGQRLDRALARYARCSAVRPPGWPAAPVAAFAHFLSRHVGPLEGPEHGMAYDVQRFNELTKQMSAYAHVARTEHAARAGARARRRAALYQLAEQTNLRLRFRVQGASRLQPARDLLDSEHPTHQAAGRRLYAAAQRDGAWRLRDQRVAAGQDPGLLDSRYRVAIRHARRWGLPEPRWDAAPGDADAGWAQH